MICYDKMFLLDSSILYVKYKTKIHYPYDNYTTKLRVSAKGSDTQWPFNSVYVRGVDQHKTEMVGGHLQLTPVSGLIIF
jgi:hypothetical protein